MRTQLARYKTFFRCTLFHKRYLELDDDDPILVPPMGRSPDLPGSSFVKQHDFSKFNNSVCERFSHNASGGLKYDLYKSNDNNLSGSFINYVTRDSALF